MRFCTRPLSALLRLEPPTGRCHRRLQLRVSLRFTRLEGTVCAWVPPPPGDRLFYAFLSPPLLEMAGVPEVRPQYCPVLTAVLSCTAGLCGALRA